ncbi:MAG: FMN-binding negative transcriptional regulator [Actinobacteria bacterium]|nr:FMN-binding negative transcriptional regulator [Actinomycetota bacterium]
MYLPKHFEISDLVEISDFVSSVRAADLVTIGPDGAPIATLMPCVWKDLDIENVSYGKLVMHMAKGNQQWKSIVGGTLGLAIIHGPQAYVSPSNYEAKLTDHKAVPTWNYQSVHLTGTVDVNDDVTLLREIVSDLTNFHEKDRVKPWSVDEADPTYLAAQLRGIVAVTLNITKVEAKYKLSQNRSLVDQEHVNADLLKSDRPEEREIAAFMPRER